MKLLIKVGFTVLLTLLKQCLFAQIMDFSVGAYHTTASYKNVRASYAYDNKLISNPELYHHSGVYLKAYEGSLISLLMNNKRLAIGEYIKIGSGIGVGYSSSNSKIEDDGRIFLYYAGVNGTDAVYSTGPIQKYGLGYQVDLNYGLQARYRLKKDNDAQTIGVRWFNIFNINPAIRNTSGNSTIGTVAAYYTHEQFSVVAEADWRSQSSDQSPIRFFSVTGRKHTNKIKKTYVGIRIEQLSNTKPALYENQPGSSMSAYNVFIQIGRMIL